MYKFRTRSCLHLKFDILFVVDFGGIIFEFWSIHLNFGPETPLALPGRRPGQGNHYGGALPPTSPSRTTRWPFCQGPREATALGIPCPRWMWWERTTPVGEPGPIPKVSHPCLIHCREHLSENHRRQKPRFPPYLQAQLGGWCQGTSDVSTHFLWPGAWCGREGHVAVP